MLVNGRHQETLAIADRAVQYGDGAFETVLVRNSHPILWQAHLQRLQDTCERLQIPLDVAALEQEALQLIASQPRDAAILKILISRGQGGRGYGVPAQPHPTRVLQLHPVPQEYARHARDGIRVMRCRHPLSINPALAGLKHLNRLDQVMASLELRADVQEGLMCDPAGNLIEGIKSNVFLHDGSHWITPDLGQAGVAGVMRAWLLERIAPVQIRAVAAEEVLAAQQMFVCNSVLGIWPVTQLHWGEQMRQFTVSPQLRALQAQFEECVE